MRVFEKTHLRVRRAGERAAHVAKQFALEQRFDNRRAIDGDESALAPRPETMERLGDQLLARAGFSGDQHRSRVRRETPHRIEQLLHARTSTDQAIELELPRDVGVDAQQRLASLDALADGDQQLAETFEIEGLCDVVECAGLDRLDRRIHARRASHEDDLRLRIGGLDLAQHLQAVDVAEPDVDEGAVGLGRRQ